MKIKKRRVFFRVFPGNRLTMPLLLNVWEKNGLDRHFDIRLADSAPGRLARNARPEALAARMSSSIRS